MFNILVLYDTSNFLSYIYMSPCDFLIVRFQIGLEGFICSNWYLGDRLKAAELRVVPLILEQRAHGLCG